MRIPKKLTSSGKYYATHRPSLCRSSGQTHYSIIFLGILMDTILFQCSVTIRETVPILFIVEWTENLGLSSPFPNLEVINGHNAPGELMCERTEKCRFIILITFQL